MIIITKQMILNFILGPYPQGQYQQQPFGPEQQFGPHAGPGAGPGQQQYPPPSQNQYPNNRQMYPPYGPPPEDS
jgi:hypothetical protein